MRGTLHYSTWKVDARAEDCSVSADRQAQQWKKNIVVEVFKSSALRFEVIARDLPSSSTVTMTDRRPDQQEMSKSKRAKIDLDPRANPYLAHMYGEDDSSSAQYGNGARTGLSDFKRHATTAEQAHKAEDGPNNPFNNAPLSGQYFKILKTRRDLPVHKQRCVLVPYTLLQWLRVI